MPTFTPFPPTAGGTGSYDDTAIKNRLKAAEDKNAAQDTVLTGLGTAATRNITVSTLDPSGGVDGDIWIKVG